MERNCVTPNIQFIQVQIKQEVLNLPRYQTGSCKHPEILTMKQRRVDNSHHCYDLNSILNLRSSPISSPQTNLQVAAEEPGGALSTH